jgi:phage regulator Rha-like protein
MPPSEFTSTHFCVNVQNQQVGTSQRDFKCYQLTKDDFMFLVIGFTGAKAAELKINFINAFN